MVTAKQRQEHERWLLELTGIPTAAGLEGRVIDWIGRWAGRRRNVTLRSDRAGNLLLSRAGSGSGAPPIFITAHLDHPAFVLRSVTGARDVELEFRGSVHAPYFEDAAVEIIDAGGRTHPARIVDLLPDGDPFKRFAARLGRPGELAPGDVGRWAFRGRGREPAVADGLLYAPACDDLAGAAAALATFDALRRHRRAADVGLLLTRAEEVGFLGAIAACRQRSIPDRARLICLENSRSFADSPIGAGPILRVGDRMTVFSPDLTNRLGLLLLDLQRDRPEFKAQRKLMAGGTCEASTFCAYGYDATCVCLPLGNYHNMVDIDAVLAGKRPARTGAEFISLADFHGMVELLLHFVEHLDDTGGIAILDRMEHLHHTRGSLIQKKEGSPTTSHSAETRGRTCSSPTRTAGST